MYALPARAASSSTPTLPTVLLLLLWLHLYCRGHWNVGSWDNFLGYKGASAYCVCRALGV
jgi:hypothetical protein